MTIHLFILFGRSIWLLIIVSPKFNMLLKFCGTKIQDMAGPFEIPGFHCNFLVFIAPWEPQCLYHLSGSDSFSFTLTPVLTSLHYQLRESK